MGCTGVGEAGLGRAGAARTGPCSRVSRRAPLKMRSASPRRRRGHPFSLAGAALGVAVLGVAAASAGVSLLSATEESAGRDREALKAKFCGPQRDPCRGAGSGALSGRGGYCALHCMWSARLCRVCCAAKRPIEGAGEAHSTRREAWTEPTREPTPEEPSTDRDDPVTQETEQPKLVFPNQLPDGTQEAMLETAAHILAIVAREDSVRIRIWVESPERNLDNIDRLAGKLAALPRAPFGRAYWRLVLRASKDRPFTLLREALAVRAAYLEGGPGAGATTASAEQEQEAGERWGWRRRGDPRDTTTPR